jgi:hypothetical protein
MASGHVAHAESPFVFKAYIYSCQGFACLSLEDDPRYDSHQKVYGDYDTLDPFLRLSSRC